MQSAPQRPVPVFPLPGIVLFPRVRIPLHVFELRYRTMVRDALSGERVIALALLKPGWEQDYYGSPEFHPVGCLAKFEEVNWLPNDCYDLTVTGVARVRFGRVVKEFPYRAARVEVLPQHPISEDDPFVAMERAELTKLHQRVTAPGGPVLPNGASFETVVNALCAGTGLESADCLELLMADSLLERGRRVRELIAKRLRAERGRIEPGEGRQN